MSNVTSTFILKLTIIVARFVSFFSFDYLCASVDNKKKNAKKKRRLIPLLIDYFNKLIPGWS